MSQSDALSDAFSIQDRLGKGHQRELGGKRAKSRFRSSISTALRIAENCGLIVPKGRNDELLAPPGKAEAFC